MHGQRKRLLSPFVAEILTLMLTIDGKDSRPSAHVSNPETNSIVMSI